MFTYRATVTNVVDGDTVDVLVDLGFKIFTKQRIRLCGVDTPERGQQGYDTAKQFLADTVSNKVITLVTSKASKWGYFLGDIYINDLHVNQMLINNGLAKTYSGGTKEIPSTPVDNT